MAVYQIVKIGDSVLREIAVPVSKITPNIIKLLDNMKDTLYDTENGIGLAAPQIGIAKRVVIIDVDDELYELINPEIILREGSATDVEGCLSVPGVSGEVTRAARVKVQALDRYENMIELDKDGIEARVLQHEIDHLDGILFIDKAVNIKENV